MRLITTGQHIGSDSTEKLTTGFVVMILDSSTISGLVWVWDRGVNWSRSCVDPVEISFRSKVEIVGVELELNVRQLSDERSAGVGEL